MTKATETGVGVLALGAIYFSLYSGVIPASDKFRTEILPYIPWWGLVAFGSYSLGTLGWGVFTFNDKEEKYEELLCQIDEAKKFYKEHSIELD